MNEALTRLVQQLTVRIEDAITREKLGTGFFLDTYTVLTCRHCIVDSEGNARKQIRAVLDSARYSELVIPSFISGPDADYAILVAVSPHNLSFRPSFAPDCQIASSCYAFGYTENRPKGDPVTFEFEGDYDASSNLKKWKLKKGQALFGHSGSPILNLDTGSIVGMIQWSRELSTDVGALALPIENVIQQHGHIQELLTRNRSIELRAPQWDKQNEALRKGVGRFDRRLENPGHFLIFPFEDDSVEEVFVEPNYKIVAMHDGRLAGHIEGEDILTDLVRILDEQRILFLIGKYGCGKTTVAKLLQRSLLTGGYDAIYLTCADIADYSSADNFMKAIEERALGNQPIYCIFDNFDEINYLMSNRRGDIDDILNYLISASISQRAHILVCTRDIVKGEQDLLEDIATLLWERRDIGAFSSIVLDYFANPQIERYLTNLADLWESKRKKAHFLRTQDLKQAHKRLIGACHNPLLLYMIVSSYYKNGIDSITLIYDRYAEFIDNTVKGKFGKSHPSISEISTAYRHFLTEMAALMLSDQVVYEEDPEAEKRFYLSANNDSLWISSADVESLVQRTAEKVLSEDELKRLRSDRLISNALSCYFFEKGSSHWRFKDDNVAYFLIAERVMQALMKLSDPEAQAKGNRYLLDTIQREMTVRMHPLWLRMLFSRLDHMDALEREVLAQNLMGLVRTGQIVLFTSDSLKQTTPRSMEIDVFLCIVLLRINHMGYKEFPFFLKSLHWKLSALKALDNRLLSITSMFTTDTKYIALDTPRTSYEGFNFDRSEFIETKFHQGLFDKARLEECVFRETKFSLCDFQDVSMNRSEGKAEFSHCRVQDLHAEYANDLEMTFKKCHLIRMRFSNCKHIKIELINCDVSDLSIVDSKKVDIVMRRTFFNEINLQGSECEFEETESFCESHHCFRTSKKELIDHKRIRPLQTNDLAV